MKKNILLKLLNDIPGDPEVVIRGEDQYTPVIECSLKKVKMDKAGITGDLALPDDPNAKETIVLD